MSERTKLLKKAVMAGVGASSSADRIKAALSDAMQDLVKVGQNLIDELEDKGKVKTETVQNFLKNLQEEATKRTFDTEKKVTSKVAHSTKKAAKEFGLSTRDDFDKMMKRLEAIEKHLNITPEIEAEVEDEADDEQSDREESKKKNRKKNQDE